MDSYTSRIDGLSAPGDMGNAQNSLELVYALRSSAMGQIADEMSTALGDVGADKATEKITKQMRVLLASDVIYSSVTRPEINGVLADNGIEGERSPDRANSSPTGPNGSKKPRSRPRSARSAARPAPKRRGSTASA